MRKIGKFPWVFYFPYRGPTSFETQIGRFCLRWCYLGLGFRRRERGFWRWHPFQLARWSWEWDTSDREEYEK